MQRHFPSQIHLVAREWTPGGPREIRLGLEFLEKEFNGPCAALRRNCTRGVAGRRLNATGRKRAFEIVHRFENTRGATLWRSPHPHPAFSHS